MGLETTHQRTRLGNQTKPLKLKIHNSVKLFNGFYLPKKKQIQLTRKFLLAEKHRHGETGRLVEKTDSIGKSAIPRTLAASYS